MVLAVEKKAWLTLFKRAGLGPGQLLHSTSAQAQTNMAMVAERDFFLPHVGVSTCGLVLLLARWATLPPAHGGLKGKKSRDAAHAILYAMFSTLPEMNPRLVRFNFTGKVSIWPGLRDPLYDVRLLVEKGEIDLNAWREYAEQPCANRKARDLLAHLDKTFGVKCTVMPLNVFLLELVRLGKKFESIAAQLCIQVGHAMEIYLFRQAEGKRKPGRGRVLAHFPSVMDSLDNYDALNSWLLKYVDAGIEESRSFNSISLASDKGHVGMNMDCGLITFPNNKAVIAVPQVGSRTQLEHRA